jgi:hypothetical protein
VREAWNQFRDTHLKLNFPCPQNGEVRVGGRPEPVPVTGYLQSEIRKRNRVAVGFNQGLGKEKTNIRQSEVFSVLTSKTNLGLKHRWFLSYRFFSYFAFLFQHLYQQLCHKKLGEGGRESRARKWLELLKSLTLGAIRLVFKAYFQIRYICMELLLLSSSSSFIQRMSLKEALPFYSMCQCRQCGGEIPRHILYFPSCFPALNAATCT